MSPQPNRFDTGSGAVVHFPPAIAPGFVTPVEERRGHEAYRDAVHMAVGVKARGPLRAAGDLPVVDDGCDTPAYSPTERNKMISRTWGYEAPPGGGRLG